MTTNSPGQGSGRPDTQVTVQLSDCAMDDARAVFDALGQAFAPEAASGARPAPGGRATPTVWITTFDVATPQGETRPAQLTAPVTALLTGDHGAVARVKHALDEMFTVRAIGTSSGEHEMDLRLLLEQS
ncbi:hypothetical protein GCM10020367_61450 [Streptomyces sannanensis]|uniref:Uncharacterized protein n=1 Tax=Streptomyces sannanensis TaxID=285536 RepID=A0ABP6SL36_9ACTN